MNAVVYDKGESSNGYKPLSVYKNALNSNIKRKTGGFESDN
ncbi:MAG: hypothetical protein ACYCYI_05945 [Saccharofermentanales bacterium]